MNKEYAKYLFKKTTDDYNLIAEEFSRARDKPWSEIKFLFDDYLILEERVLDLGCGNGRFFEFCKGKNVDYFGVDSSEKLIEIAQKRYPEARFQVADALNLPFPDSYFDKVYSIAVLHLIPSEEFRLQFLKEIKRVLKPEGLLVLTVWKLHQPKELYFILKHTMLKLTGKSKLDFKDIFAPWHQRVNHYTHCFSKKELRVIVERIGFKIKAVGMLRRAETKNYNIYLVAEK